MRAYFMSEMAYPYVPKGLPEKLNSGRVIVPNEHCDPKLVSDLYDCYMEEFMLAEELGLDLSITEHHQSMTGLGVSTSVWAGVLAARTTRARIALLGIPLPVRSNPLHVAEELAVLDCLSRGRMTVCMVRGVPTESHPSNVNPVTAGGRMREAQDLIAKAWTTREPFSWEGQHFNFRYVNVWPRPYQQPHPPIWWAAASPDSAVWAADRGYALAVHFTAGPNIPVVFDAYRKRWRENYGKEPPADNLAYNPLVYTDETDEKAHEASRGFLWYLNQVRHPHFTYVPGYVPPSALASRMLREKKASGYEADTKQLETLEAAGALLRGGPQTMIKFINQLFDRYGIGHLVLYARAGTMPTQQVRRSLELFAKEVYPAVRHLGEGPQPQETLAPLPTERQSVLA